MDAEPDPVGHGLFRHAVRLRLGPGEEPRRRLAVGPDQSEAEKDLAPAAHDPSKRVTTIMTTADMAMRMDPIYGPISRRFHEHPEEFADAFARAWFKLTHRDMGPRVALSRPGGPRGRAGLAGPRAGGRSRPDRCGRHRGAQGERSWPRGCRSRRSSRPPGRRPSTFRGSDKRGGANGARIRLAPQKDWEVNQPEQLQRVLQTLEGIQQEFNGRPPGGREEGLARRPDRPGRLRGRRAGGEEGRSRRGRALHAGTDGCVARANRRRGPSPCSNRLQTGSATICGPKARQSAEEMLVDRAQLLTLTAPEMTVLVGGLRVLNANYGRFAARRLRPSGRGRSPTTSS